MKTLSLDFVRQAIEQTLEQEHLKNDKYFGGKNQVSLMSFYEQLVEDYEVDRYTEIYRDLVNEQNRTGLIMNGTIVAPETPQIMNINSALIVPLTFNVSFRVFMKDRDLAIETIDHLIKIMRGRHFDIAEFDNGKLFMVGTIANQVLGTPKVNNGDFIGTCDLDSDLSADIETKLNNLDTNGFQVNGVNELYFEDTTSHKLMIAKYDSDNAIWNVDENDNTIPEHKSFEKYKVSISFDSMRIDEPKTLNAEETLTILFSGSATVVNKDTALGNDLTKLGVKKYKIKAEGSDITFTDSFHWLEPLEMPSSLGISNQISQLASHNFIQNKHNDGINPNFDYSFVLDKSEPLVYQWWKYARYGIQGTLANSYTDGVSPNTLYKVQEIWSYWGEIEIFEFIVKSTDNIDIENTESDALTIKLTFELQKE